MNACCLFGWWGLNLWVPAYLNLPVERGGVGLSSSAMSWFVIFMQVGMWLGYVSFGYIADAIGRKPAYVLFVLTAAVLAADLRRAPRAVDAAAARSVRRVLRHRLLQRLRRGDRGALSNRGAGHGRRASATTSAASPARRRRSSSARMAGTRGFGVAFAITGAAFLGAALMWVGIPATGNRELRA